MGRYIIKRLLWMIPVIIGVTILIFTIMYFTPGDPAAIILGSNATQADIALKRHQMGLDAPYIVRLLSYLRDVFLHFDFGTSYIQRTPVVNEMLQRLPHTVTIAVICIILQTIIGTPLGIIAAVNRNSWGDRIAMFIALFGVSIPSFWVGLMLVLVFSVKLGWLPAFGIGGIMFYILPCIANALPGIASQARQTRSSMLEVIRSDYITTARAKGLSERSVLFRHALPNALIPIITVLGNGFSMMLGGTIVIETVFAIPGIGTYMMNAINNRDYPVIQGSVVLLAIVFSLIMLLVDLIYAFVDPRIKGQYESKKRRTSHA
ncbi:MAG: ABC transporter permease [Clostridiales bacterium]|nr:ABC transporter permease [Clostridiales bacterium]